METALCLMEANEPVYPLDIVRTMRDQRAMMIQTSVSIRTEDGFTIRPFVVKNLILLYFLFQSQYRFVCESVLRAYADGIAEPLPEFRR